MKKIALIRMIEWSTSILFCVNVSAQTLDGAVSSLEKRATPASIAARVPKESDRVALANVKTRSVAAYNHFIQHFEDAADIIVGNTKTQIFIYCKTREGKNRVMYNDRGKWKNTIIYYEAAQLDRDLYRRLQYAYPQFTPFGTVTEIHVSNRVAHMVTVENCSSWKRIRIAGGELDVYEEFNKR